MNLLQDIPEIYQTQGDPLYLTYSDAHADECKFKFITYLKDSGETIISKNYFFPDENSNGVIAPGTIVKDYLSPYVWDASREPSNFQELKGHLFEHNINTGYVSDGTTDCSGVVTQQYLYSGDTLHKWGVMSDTQVDSYMQTGTTGGLVMPLNLITANYTAYEDDYLFSFMLKMGTSDLVTGNILISIFDGNTQYFYAKDVFTEAYKPHIIGANIGKYKLVERMGAGKILDTSFSPVIIPNFEEYLKNDLEIQLWAKNTNLPLTTPIKIKNIDCKSPFSHTIAWINRVGGIDQYTFYGESIEDQAVEYAESIINNYNFVGNSFQKRTFIPTNKKIIIDKNKTITICSNRLNQIEFQKVGEVINSSQAWTMVNGSAKPIIIMNSNFTLERKNKRQIHKIQFKYGK